MQNNLSENKPKKEIILTKNERNLVLLIRHKYRYGEIIIVCHDGIPQRLKKVDIFSGLHGDLSGEIEEIKKDK
jgi:hypothetical protein